MQFKHISMRAGYFLIIIFILSVWVSHAQNHTQSIRGTITDKSSGFPLIGANIVLEGVTPLTGTVSNEYGEFHLQKVAIGRLSLKITYLGYNDVLLSDLELNSAKELILNIEMTEKVYTGQVAVIYAQSDKSQPINKMAVVSAREFTVQETELYAGARSDVARMAANYAGVTGIEDSRNDIIIRGNTPSGLLWRLDGIDIPNPNHFAAFGTTGGPICILRNNLLANSDFITSAFPAEYGNALAGVFDLRTISGNNQKHEFLAQVAFNGIEAGAEGPLNRKKASSYLVNYRYSTLDVFSKLGIQMGTGQAVPKYQDIFFKFNFPRTKIGSISIFGFGGISKIAFLDSEKDTSKQKIDFYGNEGWDITNHSNQAMIGINQMMLLNSSSYIKSSLAANFHQFYTYTDSVTPVSLATTAYERSNDLDCRLTASFLYSKKFNAQHNIQTGIKASLFYTDLIDSILYGNSNSFIYKNNYRGYYLLAQPYVEWQYRIRDNLELNTGLHGQYFSYNNSFSAEPRLGLKWEFTSLHTIGLGFGMHSQMIPPTVYFSQAFSPSGIYEMGNTRLDFMRSIHAVISYDWNISENTRFKAEVYYQYLYNIPVDATRYSSYSLLNQGANFDITAPDYLINNGKGKNYGLEFTIERFMSKGFYYLGTASAYASKYKASDQVWRHTAFSGAYSLNLLAGKEFNIKFRRKKEEKRKKTLVINLKTILTGGQRYTPINAAQSLAAQKNMYYEEQAYSEKFPDYSRTDLKIAYKMNAKRVTIEWSVEITNIFNQKNVYNQTFNRQTGETYFTYQLGRMIIPQYRIIF